MPAKVSSSSSRDGTAAAASMAQQQQQQGSGEDLGEIGGLSLDSSPVKPSSSAQTRSSSSEPSSGSGQGSSSNNGLPLFIQQEDMEDLDDDDDEEGGKKGKKGGIPNPGRRKIEIEYIEDKSKRHITFSKRKAGIMKKAYELSTLTGTQVLLLVVSETGLVYTYTTNKLQPLVTAKEGKALIQACLTAEEGEPPFGDKADMPPTTPQRTRADHRKVSMQVRLDATPSSNTYTPNGMSARHEPPPVPSPSYNGPSMQQQQQQAQMQQQAQHAPQLMQPPYMGHMQSQQQPQMQASGLMPPAQMAYQPGPSNLMPMTPISNIPPMPMPPSTANSLEDSGLNSRTLKKRKTTENLRTGKETLEQAEARRTEAAQIGQDLLEQAKQHQTLGNLLKAYQQQDVATRSRPPRLDANGVVAEGLDSTIQLFQMSCEDSARGPEADQARMRGERWLDHIGVHHLSTAIDSFLNDFLVNKCIRTAKDVKAAAKDLSNFNDWLFTHGFVSPEMHANTSKQCGSTGKVLKKKASEPVLSPTSASMPAMTPMPNGLVRPNSNPQARAEGAGKTLIEYCEYARNQYDGLGQEPGVTALNGYFVVDRVRSTYVILRGIPIEGDPHSNSEAGPFKVRMPRMLTAELRPRDQFLLSLNRYLHLNHWIPTACGDVHPSSDEDMGEDPLNPQYHHMEAEKAQRMNDQVSFNYHAVEYQFSSKVSQMLEEGDLPEDGFGNMSLQQHAQPQPQHMLQAMSSHPNLQMSAADQAGQQPMQMQQQARVQTPATPQRARRQPPRQRLQTDPSIPVGWEGQLQQQQEY